jgi:hypothetical protein
MALRAVVVRSLCLRVRDRHEVARKEVIATAADIDQAFPNDFVAVGVASIGDESKKLSGLWMLVDGTEMVIAEHDRE